MEPQAPTRILLVEDSEEDGLLLSAHLEAYGIPFQLTRVDELEPLRAALGTGGWDILLSDFALPGMDGLEVLREARRLAPNLPCIVVSGQIGEEAAVAALRAGAKDFVSKSRLARLVPALQRELAESRLRAGAERTRVELRSSEDRFRAITEVALDAIVMMDPQGKVSFWNPAAQRMFGYTQQEALGMAVHDLIVDEPDRPAFEQGLARFLETGRGDAIGKVTELSGRRRDGAEFPIELSLAALRVGEAWHAVGVVRDITERRRAEGMLRDREAEHRELLELLGEGICIVDATETFLFANPTSERIFGVGLRQLVGMNLRAFLEAAEWDRVRNYTLRRRQGRTDLYEMRIRRPDGLLRDLQVTATPRFDAQRAFTGTLAICRDITEQKLAEEALRQSEEKYRDLVETTGTGYVIVDRHGRVLDANQEYVRLTGHGKLHEILGRSVLEWTADHERQRNLEAVTRCLKDGLIRNFVVDYVDRRGRITPLEINATVEGRGASLRIITLCRDISERRRSEEEQRRLQAQLQQAQKMESLGILAGGIAHDMNNVLGAILGMASAHIEEHSPGTPAYHAFDTIAKAAARGGEMVKGLLKFARQSPAEQRELDLNAVLQDDIRLLERTTLAKVRLELDLEPGLSPILGDAGALTNAFMNLFLNAVDAMPEQGTLSLRTRNLDGDWIEVLVEDTGKGMPAEVLEKAVVPFFTTKEVGKGTGLGLSMAYRVVKDHRGELEIQSQPGQGTRVRLRFPASKPAAEAAAPAAGAPAGAVRPTLDVLLVDDDELIRSTVKSILEAMGHAVFAAPGGEAALAAIAAGLEPDLVILDVNMPGLDGGGTLRRLRTLLPKVPVLLSTGRPNQAAQDLTRVHPFVTLLPKPYTLKELQRALAQLERG